MIRRSDPPRLCAPGSGASAAARALLAASRAELPSGDQLARLAQRLPLQLPLDIGSRPPSAPAVPHGPPAPLPPVPQAAAAAAAASILPGVVVGASLAIAVMTGAWWREAPPPYTAPTAPPVAAAHHHATSERAPAVLAAPPPSEPEPVESPKRAASSAPAAAPSSSGLPTRVSEQQEKVAADSPGSLGGGEGSAGSVTEIELLQRAQQALPRDPAGALATAEEHLRRFPGGVLAQEREVIAISALVALGRQGEARSRATRFVQNYPRSAHRPGIEALVPALAAGRFDEKNETGRTPTP